MNNEVITIDKVDWHIDASFPKQLSAHAAGTHIGMFVTWVFNNNLEGESYKYKPRLNEFVCFVKSRQMTGTDFLCGMMYEKFYEDDLSHEGVEFVRYYYIHEYFNDYEKALVKTLPSLYYVEDSWENYDKIAKYVDLAFKKWRESNSRSKK